VMRTHETNSLPQSPEYDLSCATVIIPALNEAASLPLVLRDLPKVGRVIVVNNGASDGTAQVALDGAATVVTESDRGSGAACLAGLNEICRSILAGDSPPSVVVFLDADYSDHPDLLPLLACPILNGAANFVLGSRLQGNANPGRCRHKASMEIDSPAF